LLEEGRSVVEDEVDTAQLLESLKTTAGSETLSEVTLEAVDIAGFSKGQLVFVIGGNLSQLSLDRGVIDIKTSQFGERASSFLVFSLLDVEPRSLGKDEQTGE